MKLLKKDIIAERENKTVYHVEDEVIKLFVKTHPMSNVFNEALIHACAEEAGIPVPALKGVSEINGRWALSMEYIEGDNLNDLLKAHPRQYQKYIDKLVDIQLEVAKHRAYRLRNTVDKMVSVINGMDEIDASTRYELLQRLHGMHRHTKICHGDFVPSNVILRKDGSYCILDWSHATQGNAGADAAITYLRFSLENEKWADYYLKTFCRKSDTAIQYVQKWLPIVAAAQLVKHIPEEKDLLEKWISVAEYQ